MEAIVHLDECGDISYASTAEIPMMSLTSVTRLNSGYLFGCSIVDLLSRQSDTGIPIRQILPYVHPERSYPMGSMYMTHDTGETVEVRFFGVWRAVCNLGRDKLRVTDRGSHLATEGSHSSNAKVADFENVFTLQ